MTKAKDLEIEAAGVAVATPVINPTVGRVVWFYPGGDHGLGDFHYSDSTKPCAALVAHVIDDHTVTLAVFDQTGRTYSCQRVPLVQAGEVGPNGNYCAWMPYQIGQAKREASAQEETHVR